MTVTFKTDLAREIRNRSNENVFLCYQCKKCTAGCPVAGYFDLMPHQILRACQFGQTDMALNSRTIAICAACEYAVFMECPELKKGNWQIFGEGVQPRGCAVLGEEDEG